MSTRKAIITDQAPAAIGTYSQAIPLTPDGELLCGDIAAQTRQVFDNLEAVARAAGSSLGQAARLTVYLTDLRHFQTVNEVMAERFEPPYPARAAVGVAALPRDAEVEIDAILVR